MPHSRNSNGSVGTDGEYQLLAAFREHLGRFFRFSEQATQAAGVTPGQYQALLAIRGFPNRERVTIAELAEQLQIAHHAAVELVDRLSAQNLVERVTDSDDRPKVFVELSQYGSTVLDKLAQVHQNELCRLGPGLLHILEGLTSG